MDNKKETVIVTIDGPAGAGKSTIAKKLAERLNFSYLDTGAMYRALTLKALRMNINLEDEGRLEALAKQTQVNLDGNTKSGLKVLLDGGDVSQDIRSLEVTNNTYYIARAPKVRSIMVQWQRAIGSQKDVVIEGRDIGTVVFPEAKIKFYLDADFEERAKRRIDELKEKGKNFDEDKLRGELKDRDHKDFTRTVGPLKKAEDAVLINSTFLSIEGVVDKMMEIYQGLLK